MRMAADNRLTAEQLARNTPLLVFLAEVVRDYRRPKHIAGTVVTAGRLAHSRVLPQRPRCRLRA